MAAPDPILSGIATQTFRLVRKGFDPEEVRSYLEQVAATVDSRLSAAGEPQPSTPAPSPDGPVPDGAATVDDARRELDRLLAEQAAVRAWFGDDTRPDAMLIPKSVRDAATTATTLVRNAELRAAERLAAADAEAAQRLQAAEAEVAQRIASSPGEASSAQRWEDVGGSVARILAGAEEEANSLRAAAEAAATATRSEAETAGLAARADAERAQAEAQEALARASRQADEITRQAEARVADLDASAADGARAHVAEVLARAEVDLDRTRRELDEAHDHLEQIHALVGRSLAHRAPRPTLGDPLAVATERSEAPVVGAPPETAAAPGPPDLASALGSPVGEAAAPVAPADPFAPPVTSGSTDPVAPPPAAISASPAAIAARLGGTDSLDAAGPDLATPPAPSPPAATSPWAEPSGAEGDEPIEPSVRSVLAAAGLEAAPVVPRQGDDEPVPRSVQSVLAGGEAPPTEDEAAWSPLRTFRGRLGADASAEAATPPAGDAAAPAEGAPTDDDLRQPGWLTPPAQPPAPPEG